MKVLLLAGQFNTFDATSPYPFTQGKPLIDWQIEQLTQHSSDIVVVLDNSNADEILRASKHLMNCELVFDANEENANFFTNLTSGLYAVNNFCFVLPISQPSPPPGIWSQMLNHYYRVNNGEIKVIRSYFPKEGKMVQTFPLVITSIGKYHILNFEEFDKNNFDKLEYSAFSSLFQSPANKLENSANLC